MTLETLNSCTACNSSNISYSFNCQDHFISGETFSVARCHDCGFHFTNPRPERNEIAGYYESDDYVSRSKTSAGLINRLFHLSRLYTLSYKKRIVSKHSGGKRLLDYGCGTGEFVRTMEVSDWDCNGIEPNPQARDAANNKCKTEITDESGLDKLHAASLDAISLWHVLEHIYPLEERIGRFHDLLCSSGTLFVALPNMQSWDARYYGPYWAAWDVPRHIHHFSPSSVKRFFKRFNFELIKTRPMLLDAFYISMLSEKYQKGKPANLKALSSGLKSNCKAFLQDGNYSSLIYIFKKS